MIRIILLLLLFLCGCSQPCPPCPPQQPYVPIPCEPCPLPPKYDLALTKPTYTQVKEVISASYNMIFTGKAWELGKARMIQEYAHKRGWHCKLGVFVIREWRTMLLESRFVVVFDIKNAGRLYYSPIDMLEITMNPDDDFIIAGQKYGKIIQVTIFD